MTEPRTVAVEMFTPPSDLDPVERAMTYPYYIPDCSYMLRDDGWEPAPIGPAETTGRLPVIATGSNRSPEQLARKYADFDGVTIPVQRAWLADFDVVFAAHITGYGSISANLLPSPGVRVDLSVTWLSADQMARMHATEGRGFSYDYAELSGLALETEDGPTLDTAFAYIHRGGALRVDGALCGIAEIGATGRPYPSRRQPEAIAEAHRRLAHDGSVDAFIHENIADRALRFAREAVLQEDAIGFDWAQTRVVQD